MRLVLVDHGGERIRGDSARFAARSPEWAECTFREVGVAKLSLMAARLLDESEGRFSWRYQYSSFGPARRGGGYDVFSCSDDLDEAPPAHFEDISNVMCECFYVGHVHCIPPVISLHSRRRAAKAAHSDGGAPRPRVHASRR
ncbi:hypothetical protein [Methylocystis echinoides]|jgi:hypothetical protein|uniref:hypothetical protein n=1 Tax=Methylocystis echinoides TaxID=29468 RepID=UPI0034334473